MLTSITIRIILIITLLTSMQTSASMLAGMGMAVASQNKSLAKVACTDMPGMVVLTDSTASKSPVKNDMSGCDHDACCLVIATIFEMTFISEKPANDFQLASVKSPSLLIKINYRPPILS